MTSRGGQAMSRRLRMALIAALGLVLLIAGIGAVVVRNHGSSDRRAWDPRIEPFAKSVERARNLTFDHPVKVRFLDDAKFEKTVRQDRKDLDADDRKDIKEATELFRAFGLISGDVDLFDAFNDATGSGTLAYYSFEDRAITVRGSELTLASHATLVHELTHALQDQRFGISELSEKFNKKSEDGEPTTEGAALDAIVEGDAERVADVYRRGLSPKEQKALKRAETKSEGKLDDLEGIPDVVLTLIGAPYALGEALTQAVASQDEEALNDLFRDPPPDDSVLLDPLKAIKPLSKPADVKIPALAEGEKSFDSGQVGSLVTYLMLAERIPVKDALKAADAWHGDAFVGFTRDSVPCARVEYAATTAAGASLLSSAFTEWIAAGPTSIASITGEGKRLTFESCDPGKGAKVSEDAATNALELVATRSYLAFGVLTAGASAKVARCFARRTVDEFSADELVDPSFGAGDPTVVKRIQTLAASCR